MTVDRREAALVVQEALSAVLDPAMVATLREDSPLAAAGMTPADAVSVADAAAEAGARRGLSCLLGDDDFAAASTVGALVDIVREKAEALDAR